MHQVLDFLIFYGRKLGLADFAAAKFFPGFLIRGKKGASLTEDGREFMQYVQQILDQAQLLERRYGDHSSAPKIFSVAAQHYAFAVDAFVQLLKEIGQSDYQASLKEMRTYEVIEDVANLHSEIGIVYLSRYNRLHQLSSIGQKYLGYLRESFEKNAKR